MKIAILIPYIGEIGGGQKVIARVASYLQSCGHTVEFFTQKYDKQTPYKEFHKTKVNILRIKSKILLPFIFLFKKFNGFDVLILNDFPATLASIRNKNTFNLCYTPKRDFYDLRKHAFEKASFKGKLTLFFKTLFFRRLDIISARKDTVIAPISKTVQKRVEKYYNRKDSEIFYCGIDFKDYQPRKYENYILCPSRFVKAKRVDVIIKSMGYVKNKKIKLYVVGDGIEKESIENLVKKYDNVKFIGRVSEEKLKNLYSNCLAVVYASINDDWALIPFEAGASGKTTIGPNEGAIPEVILDGKTGFLIENITSEKIAEKIDYLAKNKKIAKKMGAEARRWSKNFDWKVLLPSAEKLILKATEKKK